MKSYSTLPPNSSARIYLKVPIHESDDARMLGCKWDQTRRSWWIDHNSILGNLYIWHWMEDSEPLKLEVRDLYRARIWANKRVSNRNQENRRHQ